jgi:putative membrane protein
MKILRYLAWLLRAFLFVVLLLFAIKNTTPVRLQLFFEQGWDAPLVVMLLVAFALGAMLGVVACLARLFGQRREILVLRRELGASAVKEKTAMPAEPSS